MVVNWFPCWNKGWNINATLLFFYSTAPRTSCLGSPVARYHGPFEARSANSTRRETFRQLAACSSAPHGGWFAPLSIPPGSPAALAPVSEPLGGVQPRKTQQPRPYEAIENRGPFCNRDQLYYVIFIEFSCK